MKPTKPEFARVLELIFAEATATAKTTVDVRAADLHMRVGGYPGRGHSMPTCCSAMRDVFRDGDSVLCEPAGGTGAALNLRYCLPR